MQHSSCERGGIDKKYPEVHMPASLEYTEQCMTQEDRPYLKSERGDYVP